MSYYNLENKIQTGDLLECAGPWLMSRMIRKVTRSKVSHVGLAAWISFENGPRKLCMFEALEGKGLRLVPLFETLVEDYHARGGQIWWRPLVEERMSGPELLDFCMDRWTKDYANPKQFMIMAAPLLFQLLGFKKDTDPDAYHCSELVAAAVQAQGFERAKNPALTTPDDITRYSVFGDRFELRPE